MSSSVPRGGAVRIRNPVIPVFSRRLSMAADVASVQFSRTAKRLDAGRHEPPRSARNELEPADAGLSKLNSMPGVVDADAGRAPQ